MELINQVKPTECGLACVAMLTGSSLVEIRKYLPSTGVSSRTYPEHLRTELATKRKHRKHTWALGREVIVEDSEDGWGVLKRNATLALLAIGYNEARDTWHWAIYDDSCEDFPIFDPDPKLNRGETLKIDARRHLCSYYHLKPIL